MQKINFQDLPNTTTPVNATNLNLLQTNVENAIPEVKNTKNSSTTNTYGCEYINKALEPDFIIKQAEGYRLVWTTGYNEETYEITSAIPTAPTGYTLVGCIEAHFDGNMRKINVFKDSNKWYVNAYNDNQYGGARIVNTTWLYKKNN